MKANQDPRSAARIVLLLLGRLVRRGRLDVTIDGRTFPVVGRDPGPSASITFDDFGAVTRRVGRGGGVAFAEAYIDGDWDSPDLASLLELAVVNHDLRRHTPVWEMMMRTARAAWRRLQGKTGQPAVRTMVEHYDLGNEFFETWLDPSMSYSSGIFTEGSDLETAMRTKYERIADRAGIRSGDRILEIGCGWGAMAQYAAAELGCTVTAVTISPEQHAYVVQRMKRAGLEDRVDVQLADFREIRGEYDRVISIEMIESIDEALWPDLFAVIARSLVPGGTAALQVITIDDDLQTQMIGRDGFIRTYIFPGGALPSTRILRRLGEAAGLDWIGLSTHGTSYARTLAAWDERFVDAWPGIKGRSDRFDQPFYRMWRYYLAYCEAGFRTGRIDGVQVVYQMPNTVSDGSGSPR